MANPATTVIQVIAPTDISVYAGEILAVLGPSGSGKSTLLRMLTGLSKPSAGEVLWHGKPVRDSRRMFRSCSRVSRFSHGSRCWRTWKRRSKPAASAEIPRRKRSLKILETVGLDGFEAAYPKELSGGMKQRVGFARALVVEPEVLFMDEPFSALDVLTAENLRTETLELWANKSIPTRAIYIVTHNIEEAVLLADRIIVLGKNPGRIRTDFQVGLPQPRDRKSPGFLQLVDYIYKVLTQPDAAPQFAPGSGTGGHRRRRRAARQIPDAAARAPWRNQRHAGDPLRPRRARRYLPPGRRSFVRDRRRAADRRSGLDAGFRECFGGRCRTDTGRPPVCRGGHCRAQGAFRQSRARARDADPPDQARARIESRTTRCPTNSSTTRWMSTSAKKKRCSSCKPPSTGDATRVCSITIPRAASSTSPTKKRRRFRRESVIRAGLQPAVLARHATRWPFILDILVFATVLAVFYGVLTIAHYWLGQAIPVTEISRSPWSLPRYAFYSLVRMAIAYFLSLVFAVTYGRIAAYNRTLQPFMVAILDILQSIPVLSFLPGVMLAMVSLFPNKQVGVELGSIILIFTGQVWNMAFSFYSSLKSIPRELSEASTIYRFGKWQRFFQLELPYGTIGLIWNSIVSVAGGWFFLMACEMFVLGKRDFRLPGLGFVSADRGRQRRHVRDALGSRRHDRRDSSDRPARLAAGSSPGRASSNSSRWRARTLPTSPLLHLLRNSRALERIPRKNDRAVGRTGQSLFRAPQTGGMQRSATTPAWVKAAGSCAGGPRDCGSRLRSFSRVHASAWDQGRGSSTD